MVEQRSLALLKHFTIHEGAGLEIRASASNLLNARRAAPVTAQNANNFGFIATAQSNGPRNVQLGARVSF